MTEVNRLANRNDLNYSELGFFFSFFQCDRLSGLSPFMGDNDADTFANITVADYDFDDEAFAEISTDAKDFISSLLVKRTE